MELNLKQQLPNAIRVLQGSDYIDDLGKLKKVDVEVKKIPKPGNISGLSIQDLDVNVDDRGLLSEIVRIDNPVVEDLMSIHNEEDLIKQVYIVQNFEECVRAFHVHEYLVDLFCIMSGHAKFIFIDNRLTSETFANYKIVNVSSRKLQLISVPSGVFHGWKGSKDSILLSIANQLYRGKDKKELIDELRISWDFLGKDIWDIEFK